MCKVLLFLCSLLFTVYSINLDRFKQCRVVCKDYLDLKFHSNVCNAARQILPKPSVHQACIRGKKVGFEHACMSSCNGDDDSIQSSLETCKMYSSKPIPNHQFPWCRRGYDNTYAKVKEEIYDILPSLNKEKEDQILPSLNKEEEENSEKNVKEIEIHRVDVVDPDQFNAQPLDPEHFVQNDYNKMNDFEDIVINDTSINLQENESTPSKVDGESSKLVEDKGDVELVDDLSSPKIELSSNSPTSQYVEDNIYVSSSGTKKDNDELIDDEEQKQHLNITEHSETKEQINRTEFRSEEKDNVVPTVEYESDTSVRTNESEEF